MGGVREAGKNSAALFKYLGLYTHPVAISNHRLLHVDDDEIVFRTRGKKVCRLAPLEFMRRFLMHVLPRGFVKIRHFGLLAAGNVNAKLAAARTALEQRQRKRERGNADAASKLPSPAKAVALGWRELFAQLTGVDLGACPDCGGTLLPEPLVEGEASARAPPPGPS